MVTLYTIATKQDLVMTLKMSYLLHPKDRKEFPKTLLVPEKKNTTVLACGNAKGEKLPPFIIFRGKNVWQSWIPEEDYPGTMYTAQHKGWMGGGLFFKWFKESFLPFIKSTEERGGK
ncbi:hypothetical protein JTB14_017934 [Gonioctena quinquepunctata]|nr:hypothetical protein JTB14_017934 [Gonioctena quinquepunctata]